MKWVGLTGGIATGKSTVAELLRQRSVPVIDADQIVHDLMTVNSPTFQKIVQHFGRGVLSADGSIDRRALGRKVFADKTQLEALENIVHPAVKTECRRRRDELAQQKHQFAVYDVPLLFEKNMLPEFDSVICVTANETTQRARLKMRNNLTDQEIDQRLKVQLPMQQKERQSTWVIRNEDTREQLAQQVDEVLRKLRAK